MCDDDEQDGDQETRLVRIKHDEWYIVWFRVVTAAALAVSLSLLRLRLAAVIQMMRIKTVSEFLALHTST